MKVIIGCIVHKELEIDDRFLPVADSNFDETEHNNLYWEFQKEFPKRMKEEESFKDVQDWKYVLSVDGRCIFDYDED